MPDTDDATSIDRPLLRTRRATLRWHLTSRLGKLLTAVGVGLLAAAIIAGTWSPLSAWAARTTTDIARGVVGTPTPTPQSTVDTSALLAEQRHLTEQITAAKAVAAAAAPFPDLAVRTGIVNDAVAHAEHTISGSPTVKQMAFESALLKAAIGDLPAQTASAQQAKAAADAAAAAAKAAQEAQQQHQQPTQPVAPPKKTTPVQPPRQNPPSGGGGGSQATSTSITVHCTTNATITFTGSGGGTVTVSSGGRSSSGGGSASVTVSGGPGTYTASASATGSVGLSFSSQGACS